MQIQTDVPSLAVPEDVMSKGGRSLLEDHATELYEWLALVRLGSPRVLADDRIDPYLSSYSPPSSFGEPSPSAICKLRWEGFLSPQFLRKILVEVSLAVPSDGWFAFSATSFSKGVGLSRDEMLFLRVPGGNSEYISWEVRGTE